MTTQEFCGPVSERRGTRAHRHAVQVPANIGGELVDAGIAQPWVLGERLCGNLLQIALEPAAKTFGYGSLAQRRRLLLAHHPYDLREGAAGHAIRTVAGQQ